MFRMNINTKPIAEKLVKAGQVIQQSSKRGLFLWAENTLRYHANKVFRGGEGLTSRTGEFRRSFTSHVSGEWFGNLRCHLFSTYPYARAHEYGVDIYPKVRKLLAVPIYNGPAIQGGVERYRTNPSDLKRTIPDLLGVRPVRAKDGNLYLVDRWQRAWYKLVAHRRIEPKLKFREAVANRMRQLKSFMRSTWREALGSGRK